MQKKKINNYEHDYQNNQQQLSAKVPFKINKLCLQKKSVVKVVKNYAVGARKSDFN